MRLNHVAISVKDMERSLAFWRDALGLQLIQDRVLSGPDLEMALMETETSVRMVILADEVGNMIELLEWQSPPVRERPPEHLKFTSTGLVEVCLSVADLERLEEDLAKKGIRFRTPVWILNIEGIDVKVTHVVDPDGVQVELIQI